MVGPGFHFYSADSNYDGGTRGLWLGPTAGRTLYLRSTNDADVTTMLKAAKLIEIHDAVQAAKRASVL